MIVDHVDLVEQKSIAEYLERVLGFASGRLYVEGTRESGLPGMAIIRVAGVPRLTDEEHAAIAACLGGAGTVESGN